jgi:flagellar biogenesis protein FliO
MLLVLAGSSPLASGAEVSSGDRIDGKRIPFKQPEQSTSGLILRVLGSLAVVAFVGVGVVYLVRRYLPSSYHSTLGGSAHIRVVEARRLTPKTTLFVIEFDNTKLLLGQSGDRIVTLSQARESMVDGDTSRTQ